MLSPAYEGGSGGNIKRLLFRSRARTPYDRPPPASRGLRSISAVEGKGGRWLSKLVDPASRFITRTASRFFSSVFRSEEKHLVRLDAPEVILTEQRVADCHNSITSEADGNSDLEQLLRQRRFTRVEVKHLMELISSRTAKPHNSESGNNMQKIPLNGVSSPEEIASAYMSSVSPKVSTPAVNLQVPVFQEGVASLTAKPQGRSAIYRLSRSPYFKFDPLANMKMGSEFTWDASGGPLPSQLLSRSNLKSYGKQARKRDASVLDDDNGLLCPTYKTPKKSAVVSPSTDARLAPSSIFGLSSVQVDKDDKKACTSTQKSASQRERKYIDTGSKVANGDNFLSLPNVAQVSVQSGETGQRILEQLHKLAPSPKEKHTAFMVDVINDEDYKNLRDPQSEKGDKAVENVPFTTAVSGGAIAANGMNDASSSSSSTRPIIRSADATISSYASSSSSSTRPIIRSADTTISSHATPTLQKTRFFRVTASEDSLGVDEEDDESDASVQSSLSFGNPESNFAELRTSVSDLPAIERHLLPSFEDKHVPSFISLSKTTMNGSAVTCGSNEEEDFTFPILTDLNNEEGDFTFPVLTDLNNDSPRPPTPTMPNPSHAMLTQKDQIAAPVLSFSSWSADASVPSSVTNVASQSQGQKLLSNADQTCGSYQTLNEALSEEVQRLKIATGQIPNVNGNPFNRGFQQSASTFFSHQQQLPNKGNHPISNNRAQHHNSPQPQTSPNGLAFNDWSAHDSMDTHDSSNELAFNDWSAHDFMDTHDSMDIM